MRASLRRALSSFLAVPTGVIIIFVLLALGTYSLEQADLGWLQPLRNFVERNAGLTYSRRAFCDSRAGKSVRDDQWL